MKLTFYSNFLNHHQLPFCEAMYKRLGNNFKFIATEQIPQGRLDMGYSDMNKDFSFVIRTYESEKEEEKANKLAIESDVIILGSAPNEYVDIRMRHNKLTFRYAERLFKKVTIADLFLQRELKYTMALLNTKIKTFMSYALVHIQHMIYRFVE